MTSLDPGSVTYRFTSAADFYAPAKRRRPGALTRPQRTPRIDSTFDRRSRTAGPRMLETKGADRMKTFSRRTLLRNTGLLGATALLTGGLRGVASADKPLSFSGWVFKPDTVKDYVNFYNQKFGGQVKYEAIPWAKYHPTMETRALAGELVDVMYCNNNNRERRHEHGLIRQADDLPVVGELEQ